MLYKRDDKIIKNYSDCTMGSYGKCTSYNINQPDGKDFLSARADRQHQDPNFFQNDFVTGFKADNRSPRSGKPVGVR